MSPIICVPFRCERIAVVAGVQLAIMPPIHCSSVTIGNTTLDDLRVETVADGSEYFILPNCFEREINLSQSGSATAQFRPNLISFWLRPVLSGTVILLWI